jgi:hypothetical protein
MANSQHLIRIYASNHRALRRLRFAADDSMTAWVNRVVAEALDEELGTECYTKRVGNWSK